jgi:acetate kinase
MHILTLKPTLRSLAFAGFTAESDEPAIESALTLNQFDRSEQLFPPAVFAQLNDTLRGAHLPPPHVIGVRALFGGERFPGPVFATDAVLHDLASLAPQAPLHLPRLVELVKAMRSTFPNTPVALVFETSFFVNLPPRERWYGLDPELMESQAVRRFGYQGIFHDAACRDAARQLRLSLPRVLSVCLEPRPELAACQGRRPVVVTSGNTPVEGLPGETTCGDLDPSVVLKLACDTRWGPEEVSRILTCESGLRGLLGRDVSLAELLRSTDDELQLARDLFGHCVLRACGAGIAAMGGLDAIVYSGRYAACGPVLHAWLSQRLSRATRSEIPCLVHARTLFQQLFDIVRVMRLEAGDWRPVAGDCRPAAGGEWVEAGGDRSEDEFSASC